MFTLIATRPVREILQRQAPAMAGSLVIAEAFYKWHSFTLEAIGFLATWAAIDAAVEGLIRVRRKRPPLTAPR
jgi:hypothetical protein